MLLFVCDGDRVIIVIIVLLLGGGVVVVVIAIFLIVDTQVCSFGGFLRFHIISDIYHYQCHHHHKN